MTMTAISWPGAAAGAGAEPPAAVGLAGRGHPDGRHARRLPPDAAYIDGMLDTYMYGEEAVRGVPRSGTAPGTAKGRWAATGRLRATAAHLHRRSSPAAAPTCMVSQPTATAAVAPPPVPGKRTAVRLLDGFVLDTYPPGDEAAPFDEMAGCRK